MDEDDYGKLKIEWGLIKARILDQGGSIEDPVQARLKVLLFYSHKRITRLSEIGLYNGITCTFKVCVR